MTTPEERDMVLSNACRRNVKADLAPLLAREVNELREAVTRAHTALKHNYGEYRSPFPMMEDALLILAPYINKPEEKS